MKLIAIESFSTDEILPTAVLLRAPVNNTAAYCPEVCGYPCEGEFTDCAFHTEMGNEISDLTMSTIGIVSAIVDGIQYVPPGPAIDLGATVVLTNVGGINVVTNLITALNGMGIPYFTASLPTAGDLTTPPVAGTHVEVEGRLIRLQYPACIEFEILLMIGEVSFMRITHEASYAWNAGWDELTSPPYFEGYYPEDTSKRWCVTTDLCP